MFGNLNKPAFGSTTPNTSFGFGATSTTNANPFGQSQLFGKPTTGGFGNPSTSSFNLQPTNTPLFPSTQPTNMFPTPATTFGNPPAMQSSFGSTNLFGQQQPSSSGLFNTSSTFGQQNKPAGFGFGTQSTQPSLFGQQPQQQPTATMFQPSTTNLFGGSTGFGGQQTTGTVVKFNPVTGTDTMMKNGVAQSINTKHHSITCMKEYENKSFEELRFEDYAANRKGPQQPSFGATPFGSTVSSAPSLFGQPDASKSAFSQSGGFTQTGFGQNTGFGLGNQQQGLFGKPTGFGAPTSSTSTFGGFGNTAQNTNPFGTNQAKPFGGTSQPIFGTNTSTTASGLGTGFFGQTTQNTGNLFAKPAQSTTGFGQTGTGFSFSTPASTQTNSLFQSKPLFGQTGTNTSFGQTNAFGATTGTQLGGGLFNKPSTPAFGVNSSTGFGNLLGGMQPTSGSSLFDNSAKTGLFGNTGNVGLFGNANTGFQTTPGFGQLQQAQQTIASVEQQSVNLALLTSDPFGDAPHLAGLESKSKNSSPVVTATDPKELKALLDASKRVDSSNNNKLKVIPIKSVRDSLFEGISPKNGQSPSGGDYTKSNCRRLILKHRPSNSGDGHSQSLMKLDILKQISSPDENKNNSQEGSKTELTPRSAPLRLNFENTTLVDDQTNHISSPTSQNFIINNSIINSTQNKDNSQGVINENRHLEDDDESTSPRDVTKKHPCGIICTRPEYYTLPNLEALPQFVDENGRCIVKGFTIGRKGYGNVYFPDEMDITDLNIDELVHFRYREINVYPDDSKKPPVGQGLNRKAQVTLDNVYPRKVGTNTLIKDVNELQQMNFAEKLRKITERKDAKFVDYRPETGSWVFKVNHF